MVGLEYNHFHPMLAIAIPLHRIENRPASSVLKPGEKMAALPMHSR